jgi:hypothetical protein
VSWTPPERPEWVAAINRGEILSIAEEAALPLSRDALLGEACARQGVVPSADSAAYHHRDFAVEAFVENLDRLTLALEEEAALTIIGRVLTRRFLLRILEVRIQIMRYLADDPGVQDERIASPLFVAGAPRTGTTILHALLAADPRHRVPEGWELLRPVPPPDPDPGRFASDPRIALADRELVRPQAVVSGLRQIHSYGGRKPKECLSAMSFALQSEEFTARYHVPSYATWLEKSDMTPAYDLHRLVLRILQRRCPGTAWVLKSPVHLHSLSTLFETYPDARVAITHRDPLVLLGSLTSLIATLRFAHSDRVDVDAIAHSHHERYRTCFDALVDATKEKRWPSNQLHHSLFEDFQRDPMAVLEGLYERFGITSTEAIRESQRRTLDRQPRDEHGAHHYALHELDSCDDARSAFRRYQSCFEVPDAT